MNRLDPDLKRLMTWSRSAPPLPEKAPFGFVGRVVANNASLQGLPPFLVLQKLLGFSAWISAAVILCGGIFLISQIRQPASVFDFMPAYQFVARSIAP
jgi:hypothetical protein